MRSSYILVKLSKILQEPISWLEDHDIVPSMITHWQKYMWELTGKAKQTNYINLRTHAQSSVNGAFLISESPNSFFVHTVRGVFHIGIFISMSNYSRYSMCSCYSCSLAQLHSLIPSAPLSVYLSVCLSLSLSPFIVIIYMLNVVAKPGRTL